MVDYSILHHAVERFLEPDEFWTGEKCEEGKGVIRRFHSNVHGEVRKSEKEGMCNPITCRRRDVRFVRR